MGAIPKNKITSCKCICGNCLGLLILPSCRSHYYDNRHNRLITRVYTKLTGYNVIYLSNQDDLFD